VRNLSTSTSADVRDVDEHRKGWLGAWPEIMLHTPRAQEAKRGVCDA
jgi:hypothetical protein